MSSLAMQVTEKAIFPSAKVNCAIGAATPMLIPKFPDITSLRNFRALAPLLVNKKAEFSYLLLSMKDYLNIAA